MTLEAPAYFVQTADWVLHAYYTRQILLCDLAANRGEPVRILKLKRTGGGVDYVPVTEQEIRSERAA